MSDVVTEVTSGDWGEELPGEGSVACRVLRGTDFSKAARGHSDGAPTRYITGKSLVKRRVAVGDVLVELSGGSQDQPTGRALLAANKLVACSTLPVAFSNFVKRLQLVRSEVVPEYFASYWQYLYSQGRTRIYEKRTTGIRNFKLDDFLRTEWINLPPLAEQRAIAHALEAVQRAREATETVLAATRELKRSLLRHLFTYGPEPVDQADKAPLRETKIGIMPENWSIAPVGSVSARLQYGLSERGSPAGLYPILRMNNLMDGRVAPTNLQYVDVDQAVFDRFRLSRGDLLFNRTNSHELVGKVGLFDLPGDYVFASYLVRVTIDQANVPEYFAYYLNDERTQARLKHLAARAVSQSNISASKLRGFVIPLPPPAEQRRIVEVLSAVDRKLAAEQQRSQALDALFKSLLDKLMSGAIRVLPPGGGEGGACDYA